MRRIHFAGLALAGVALFTGGYAAGQTAIGKTQLTATAMAFGLSILLVAVMPTLVPALIIMVGVGVLSVLFITLANTTLQLTTTATIGNPSS